MNELLTMPRLLLALGGLLSMYLYSYMHRTFFTPREWVDKRKSLVLMIYALDWILVFAVNMLEFAPANLAVTILSFFIPLFICYYPKNLRGFVYYGFYLLGSIISELLFALACGALNERNGLNANYDGLTPQVSVMMNLMEIMIVLLICRFSSKEKSSRLDHVMLLSFVTPVISLAMIVFDELMLGVRAVKDFNPGQLMRTSLMLLVINIIVFIILEEYTRLVKKDMQLAEEKLKAESDADIMGIAAKSMRERLSIAEQVLQQDRMMRHDRRHFEALMYSLLDEGKTDEVKKCLKERLEMEPHAERRFCDNTSLNAAIVNYVSLAEKKGIRIDISTNIPKKLSVDEMELAITVSNLLENAIHACMELPEAERYIKFTAKCKEQLLLEIENSCLGTVKLDEEGHPFSNLEDHGIGTRSVLAFANKTDSEVYYIANDGSFKVRMMIGA